MSSVSSTGKKIGPYEVLDEIGSGGMAVVYKAEQTSLARAVAIKELRTELAKDPSIIARFEREARCIAALAHQNIVHIYDFITRGSSMYIVMEFVEGIDLFDLMSRVERLPPDIAGIIALQAARALEYAHFHGVVHRDFKPSNLMLTKQGEVKLMDFGIARDESDNDLTRPGIALGTPAYMSPEQIMGEKVSFRSDIFSFGIVLYQMVTGQKPFTDDETASVMNRIVNEPYERPRAVYPDIPRTLQKIIKRCLNKEPRNRYPSTEHLRRDLEHFVASRVPINFNGRLVIYLQHKGLISEEEAKTYVQPEELKAQASMEIDSGKIDGWNALLKPMLGANALAALGLLAFTAGLEYFQIGVPPAQLKISAVPWAEVYVDGEHVATTPVARPIELRAGTHRVEFKNAYFESELREVDLGPGQTERLHVELKRRRR